ncbi:MAG: type 1 glutamine amidotransferase [Planctomycetota bacterium]
MRLSVLTHVPFEGPAMIAGWASERGHTLTAHHLHRGDPPPAPEAYDGLIVMGGPMSVNDGAEYPWLADEKAAVAAAIQGGRPVLGVCLGAQLIADVLGTAVTKNRVPEIGWFPVRRTPESAGHPLLGDFPDEATVLHWHGETFAIPDGATRLFASEHCPNQAFAVGAKVLGLQFHLEMDGPAVEAIAGACADELVESPTVRPATELIAGAEQSWDLRPLLYDVLDRLFGQ